VTTDNNKHILIDCGHNSTTGWRPSTHLRNLGIDRIDRLIITNCDSDHASDLPNLRKQVYIASLARNATITEENLRQIKGVNMSPGIDELASMLGTYTELVTDNDFGGINLTYYRNRYPDDFTDENNLSLVVILTYGQFGICFPGDMEEDGWLMLAANSDLLDQIESADIFVASHHGRENGCCDLLYDHNNWKPDLTIISDSGIECRSWSCRTMRHQARGRCAHPST
jgi:beta-lactamase superfamily II metal-dependent hydrolase